MSSSLPAAAATQNAFTPITHGHKVTLIHSIHENAIKVFMRPLLKLPLPVPSPDISVFDWKKAEGKDSTSLISKERKVTFTHEHTYAFAYVTLHAKTSHINHT